MPTDAAANISAYSTTLWPRSLRSPRLDECPPPVTVLT
jgi:hypothetical protein